TCVNYKKSSSKSKQWINLMDMQNVDFKHSSKMNFGITWGRRNLLLFFERGIYVLGEFYGFKLDL
ncbi:MAG: hypothetical protein QXL89_09285, partial [Nitrososphaeria archaeon]